MGYILADDGEIGNVHGTCVRGLLGGENGWDSGAACEGRGTDVWGVCACL